MSDEDQIDLHGDIDPTKLVDIPVEELLEEPAEDLVPLLADEHDEYEQRDMIDLVETPDFMDPYEESSPML